MKFFRNDWNMASDSSWWGLMGSAPTSSGVRVSQETSLTYSAVFACTRVISETLASLPLFILEQTGEKSARRATEHPLYPILHDMPNPEMDVVTFLDMQQPLTMNWGNSFAEIQRNSVGKIVALWPIHASRIPKCNIKRNPRRGEPGWDRITAGQPGEKVYYVRNDDGTTTAIPASDMFHVPGVMPDGDGFGRSIPLTGSEAIGIGMATEQHAGAFFRNGAAATMALSSPKVIGKDTAERLREQWQRVYGGVKNHYKTLILEEGMEPKIFSMSPEASQLIEQRGLNHRVVATQLYRVPSHKIGDKEASTFNNVEQEEIAFARDTMLAWVLRWEKAIHRQLLTAAERDKYRAKFNMLGLLRGDSQSRAQFYQVLFNIGAFSPNDIRELEDMNPIDGGDQYFVPANNLVPLDKIGEMAQAQIDSMNEPAQQPAPPKEPEPDEEVEDSRYAEVLARIEQRDTMDAERVAIRQHRVQEVEENLRDSLRMSIAARIVGMTDHECWRIRQATAKPGEFPTKQAEFYAEFVGKFEAALRPFEKPAERLGFSFNAGDVAAIYCRDSEQLLEPLLDVPVSELATRADEIISVWHSRPDGVANFIIPRRSDQCAA